MGPEFNKKVQISITCSYYRLNLKHIFYKKRASEIFKQLTRALPRSNDRLRMCNLFHMTCTICLLGKFLVYT